MKKSLEIISIFLFVGSLVVGCSNNNNPQQSSSSKPEEKNYEGRIKSAEFTVLDLTNGITNVDDPRYYEDCKSIDAY